MYNNYTDQVGDTFDSIASKFNISSDILKSFSGDNINSEEKIIIPKNGSKYFDYYTVTKGDTLYKIANDNNINSSLLAELNGLNEQDYIYPNQVLLVPKAGSIIYITGMGDTLSEVVKGFKTNIANLMEENENIYLQPEQLIVYKYK